MRKEFTRSFTKSVMALALVAFGCFSLSAQMSFEITSPASVAGDYYIGYGSFGGNAIPEVSASLMMVNSDGAVNPTYACEPVTNDLTGRIAVIERGAGDNTCDYSLRAYHAQEAGAVAALICNHPDGAATEEMRLGAGDSSALVTIPTFMVGASECNAIRTAMMNGDVDGRVFYANWGFDDVLYGDAPNGWDFSQPLDQIGWTTVGISDPNALWKQEPTSTTDGSCGSFRILSPTTGNGAVMFDGDGFLSGGSEFPCGTGVGIAGSELISPVVDCSDFDAVAVRLWQFNVPIDLDEEEREVGTAISWTTDGNVWTTPEYLPTATVQNTSQVVHRNAERYVRYIPEAAGAENFQFKLIYDRPRGFYSWTVDDIALIRPPEYDLELSSAFYTPLSYATPVNHITTDTFGFSGTIRNKGTKSDVPVELNVKIEDAAGTTVYMDQTSTVDVLETQLDTFISNFDSYIAKLDTGKYTITYVAQFAGGVVDELPEDNMIQYEFEITPDIFGKELVTPGGFYIESRSANYFWGNFYTISEIADANNRMFVGAELAVGVDDETWDTESFPLFLMKWIDDNDGYPQYAEELNTSTLTPLDRPENFQIVALANVQANGQGQNELFDLNVEDGVWFDENFETLTELELEAGATYALVAQFESPTGAGDGQNIGFSNANVAYDLPGLPGMLYNPTGGNDYFSSYNGSAPIVRLRVSSNVANENVQLEDDVVSVYPTLTNDVVNIEMNFDSKTEVFYSVTDMSGRVHAYQSLGAVSEMSFTQQVADWAAGNYIVNIETPAGRKTVKVTVAK